MFLKHAKFRGCLRVEPGPPQTNISVRVSAGGAWKAGSCPLRLGDLRALLAKQSNPVLCYLLWIFALAFALP